MVVENLELVEVRVPEELGGNDGLVAVDDGVVVPGPHLQTVGMARGNVA